MSPRRDFVQTGSYRTHYLEAGTGDPVVLVHGGGPGADSVGNWSATLPLFTQRFRVLAYDMVGFGASDAPDPAGFEYSMDARADQLIAVVEALAPGGRVSAIGNSMGGAAVLGAAMKRPELFRNLILMGSAGLTRVLSPVIGKLMHYDFTLEGMQRIATALAYPGFSLPEDSVRYRYELTLRPAVRQGTAATQAWVKQHGGLYYEESALASIKNRTLVFHGKNDPVVPVAHAYHFLELLENAHGYILPHCGHWAMLEHPALFAAVCTQFITPAS